MSQGDVIARPAPVPNLDQDALALIRIMAADRADRYIGEVFCPQLYNSLRAETSSLKDLRAAMLDPYRCVRAFFAHYAFNRRGKDRDELGAMAVLALNRVASPESFPELLREPDGSRIWQAFCEVCVERKRKNSEQLNQGVIAGIVELAQEIYALDGVGNISNWVMQGVMATDRVEPQFLRIVDIRGVGPKTTSMFLRDICFLLNLEDQIDPQDRLFIQPIDRWTRQVAEIVVPELQDGQAADWIIAGKLAKYTRRAGVSGIRFNMGTSFFGMREVRDLAMVPRALQGLLSSVTSREL